MKTLLILVATALSLATGAARADSLTQREDTPVAAAPSADTVAEADTTPIRVPFGPGERLDFVIKWKFITAGRATIEMVEDSTDSTALRIRTRAFSTGFVDVFFKVRDSLSSVIDRRTFWPRRFEKHLREGSFRADSVYEFDQERRLVHSDGNTVTCSTRVHDILSVLYRARTMPMTIGESFSIDVYEGGVLYGLEVSVLRRETIRVEAGEFDCLVVEPHMKSDAIFKQKGRLWIWLTDDWRRIPVLMKSAVLVGSIDAELRGYTPPQGSLSPSRP